MTKETLVSQKNCIKLNEKRLHRFLIVHAGYQWAGKSACSVAVMVLDPIGVLEYTYFRAGALPSTIGSGSITLDSAQNGPSGDSVISRGSKNRDFDALFDLRCQSDTQTQEFLTIIPYHVKSLHPCVFVSRSFVS